ncbi:MAG: hypothetical protein DRP45_01360 [Candidatus Zixiibacteriota bacterium]|nr:MAG: hypothetical protein DRP45_01360 [candidate division Zixibacteria bacterium]
MKRIRTTGEYSLADGNASGSQKLLLSDKAAQWASFLARHASMLGAFDDIDINLKSVPVVTRSVDTTLTADNVGNTYRSVSGGDSPVVFTLPGVSAVSGNAYFRFLRGTEDIAVRAASGEDILMPWGAQTGTDNGIFCDFGLGEILLVCDGTQWIPISGIGEWHNNGSGLPPREFVRFSAEVSDGSSGDVTMLDDAGRLVTSLVSIDRFLLTQNIPDGQNSSATIGVDSSGLHVITESGGDDPVVLTLPTIGSGPGVHEAGSMYTFMVGPVSLEILPNTSQYIDMPWGAVTPSDKVRCDDEGGVLKLVQYTDTLSNCRWKVVYGVGEWYLSSDSTKRHHYDGNVVGATENNLASFDSEGNIKDSGYAGTDFAAVEHASEHLAGGDDELAYRGEVFLPITEAFSGSDSPPSVAKLFSDLPGAVWVRKFDSTSQEDLTFAWEIPDDVVAANGIRVTVVGVITEATAPASGEGVVFGVKGFSVGNGIGLGQSFGTAQTSKEDDLYAAGVEVKGDRFNLSQSVPITLPKFTAGDLAFINLYRDVADSADDYSQDVGISGIRILYTKKPIAGW